ncbi:MAG TPA: hypothetical protein VNA69_06615 [Thermoanaerobaculia bacterium]|nr:hypothetical protein [Thermoanaerobaculia bacterium]
MTSGGRHSSNRTAEIEKVVAETFRSAGWRVRGQPREADLVVRKGKRSYVIEIKAASEARSDRLIPLMAQAILQARSRAKRLGGGTAPLAVVGASRVPTKVLDQIREFARLHAPEAAIGVVDLEGLRVFAGAGLSSLSTLPQADSSRTTFDKVKVDLFSDLNQWLLKVLLAPYLEPRNLLNAPVGHYRNASELAKAASVSIMTAFRFLRELTVEGFLHESSRIVRLVRLEELLRRWQSAAVRPIVEIPVRWLLPGEKRALLRRSLAAVPDRACVGLFAAADALHLGIVRGVPIHIYVSDLRAVPLSQMSLLRIEDGRPPEAVIRVAAARESVFRGAVRANGMPVCDVLQVWLDVANHPSRGAEQAQVIFKRVIKPMMERMRALDG